MITDFFSHKIHSSRDDWPDKLVELAFLFSEFDGQIFDRSRMESRLLEISPRSAYAPRDASKFRDEISAYPAYLGLYRLEQSCKGWIIRLSETAKRFLVREEPNVGVFMRLQLALFQYPNGMGAVYYSGTNKVRIQANSRDKTLEYIQGGVHLSPLRLLCKALIADSILREIHILDAFIKYSEIYALANSTVVNMVACPDEMNVTEVLREIRAGEITAPSMFERRFHILRHTEMFELISGHAGGIRFRDFVNEVDRKDLISKIEILAQINNQFDGFDNVEDGVDLQRVISHSDWGYYFDGARTLDSQSIGILGSDVIEGSPVGELQFNESQQTALEIPSTYEFRSREHRQPAPRRDSRNRELANPEVTRIKRQRRNLEHKILVDRVDEFVRQLGVVPVENSHIDLYAEIPDDGSFLFEMKSEGQSLLDQIRKGISQLYEYRFRYRDVLKQNVNLCLVLSRDPRGLPWIYEYVCLDREICMIWFGDSGTLEYPEFCDEKLSLFSRPD